MPNIKLVMGRGSNASGKTTIAKDLIVLSSHVEEYAWVRPLYDGDVGKYPKTYATVMSDIGWACIGAYPSDKKMGGCDTFSGQNTVYKVKRAIADTLNIHRNTLRGIYWEGMMISTISSTWYNYMLELQDHDVDPFFVIFKTTVEGCLKRIEQRGTAKPNLNVNNIADKCALAIRSGETLEEWGSVAVRWIDVEHTKRGDMLTAFFHAIGEDATLIRLRRVQQLGRLI
jgi:hypothetical protein